MIDLAWMENELDQFHEDHSGRKNMKLLIDFDNPISIEGFEGTNMSFEVGKPKMKKKLTANPFIPIKKGRNTLF